MYDFRKKFKSVKKERSSEHVVRTPKAPRPQVNDKGFGVFTYTADSKSRKGIAVPLNASYREVKRFADENRAFWKMRSGRRVAGVWISNNKGFKHGFMTNRAMRELFGVGTGVHTQNERW